MDSQLEFSDFDSILRKLNSDGRFMGSVLASHEGLPVAAVPTQAQHDPDAVAAMVTMVREFIQQTQDRLNLAEVDEVSIVVRDRSRIVCRYFNMDGQCFVLAVIAGPNITYRRLTSHAVRDIKDCWAKSTQLA